MGEVENSVYRKLVDAAMLAGTILIASGAETYRVEDTTQRILKTSGFVIAESFVLPTGITLTLSNETDCTYSITKRISPGSSNMNRIITVNGISRDFCSGKISLDEAFDKLKTIQNEFLYKKMFKVFGTSLAGAGFAMMFGGDVFDGFAALICSFFIGLALYYFSKIMRKDIFINLFSAAVLCIMASGMALFANKFIPSITLSPQFIIAGSMMTLVPGLTLTNAIRDLLHGDYLSACARMAEAIVTAVSIALGAMSGLYFTHLIGMTGNELAFVLENTRLPLEEILTGIFASFAAMTGFAIIYDTPKKFLFISPIVGVVSWIIYIVATLTGVTSAWASFLAALSSAFSSFFLSKIFKAPVTLFLVAGIIPLVPGFYIYRASYYLITGSGDAGRALVNTFIIAGAIALGIILMEMFIDLILRLITKTQKIKQK